MTLRLAVELTADASGLRGELKVSERDLQQLRGATEGAGRSAGRSAGQIDRLGQATGRSARQARVAETAYRELRTAIGAVAAAEVLRRQVALADGWSLMASRIRVVTDSTAEAAMAQQRLVNIALSTRQSLEATTALFQRVSLGRAEIGASAEEILKFTENVNNLVVVSGANANEARNAIIQLAQGLASGQLRGEELRSVMEQLPALARTIAESMGVTIGKFRELAEQGEITPQIVLGGVLRATEEIDRKFAQIRITVGQAITNLSTQWQQYIGQTDQGLGATAALAEAITALGENLGEMIDVVTVAAVVFGARYASRALTPTITQSLAAAKAQVTLTAAVARGSAVALDSARAEGLRARASALASSQALVRARNAEAAVAAELASIKASQQAATAERVLEEQRLRAQFTAEGRRRSLNRLADQRRAEVAMAELAAKAEADLARQRTVTAAATANATRAQAAYAAATTRATLAARAGALATRALSGAMALVGGPVGAGILAASALYSVLANRTSEAEAAQQRHTEALQQADAVIKGTAALLANLAKQRKEDALQALNSSLADQIAKREELVGKLQHAQRLAERAISRGSVASAAPHRLKELNAELAETQKKIEGLQNKLIELVTTTAPSDVETTTPAQKTFEGLTGALADLQEQMQAVRQGSGSLQRVLDLQEARRQLREWAADNDLAGKSLQEIEAAAGLTTAEFARQIAEARRLQAQIEGLSQSYSRLNAATMEHVRLTRQAQQAERDSMDALATFNGEQAKQIGELVELARTPRQELDATLGQLSNLRVWAESTQGAKALAAAGLTAADAMAAIAAASKRAHEEFDEASKKGTEGLDALSAVGRSAFEQLQAGADRIGSAITEAFVQGKGEAVDFFSVVQGLASEAIQMFLRLSVFNPALNGAFGLTGTSDALPVLSSSIFGSLFHGGGGGARPPPPPPGGGGGGGPPPPPGAGGAPPRAPGAAARRAVPAGAFKGAPRLHGGGFAGDEVPAVLRKGEGVFTPEQMDNASGLISAMAALAANRDAPVELHLHGADPAKTRVSESRGANGGRRLDVFLDEQVAQLMRPGTRTFKAAQSGFAGMAPATVRR